MTANWPPDYAQEIKRRIGLLRGLNKSIPLQEGAKRYYKDNPKEFINDWCWTYDPRKKAPLPKHMPFILFPRQEDLVDFLCECIFEGEGGLIEKCRDMGATWVCSAISVWLWLFHDGSAIGWGSRKEQLVDRMGDPDAIFPKMRMIMKELPRWMMPDGFTEREHSNYMKILNAENGSNIVGEAGDNIGRGGRSMVYFKDEAAYYERPLLIEAALSENTDCQIDISSVHGTANVFYQRRMSGEEWEKDKDIETGKVRVFVMDWRDHPLKTQEWYDRKRRKAENEGMLTVFNQEIERDYSASIDRIVIPPEWVRAAIDAHITLGIKSFGNKVGALDVADEGIDKHAFAARKGIMLVHCEDWATGDGGEAAYKAHMIANEYGLKTLNYDAVGVGAAAKTEFNRLGRESTLNYRVHPWRGNNSVQNPNDTVIPDDYDSPKNEDFFYNLKAQAWWNLRVRFEKTYKMIEKGYEYPHEDLISIPSNMPNRHQLEKELSQAQIKRGDTKMQIDKTPDDQRSPNMADAVVMCYTPAESLSILDVL